MAGNRFLSLGAIVLLLACTSAAADDEELEPVIVTGHAPRATEEKAPTGFATEIDARSYAEQVETVGDALAESVGTSVRRFGGLGSFSTLSIRGSGSNQVQIYLDGVRLSRASNQTVNLADLPIDNLERIEVYRGTTPLPFGTAGIGGVVNLITKAPSSAPTTSASASYGSFDTRKLTAAHSQRLGAVDLLAHATYFGSDGDFEFDDDRGTRLNPLDDRVATRRNNQFDSAQGLLKAGIDTNGGGHGDLTSEFFWRDQGLPNTGNNQALHTSLEELRTLNYLRFVQPRLAAVDLDVNTALFAIYERQSLDDRYGELIGLRQSTTTHDIVAGGNLLLTYTALPWQEISWFNELAHERFDATNHLAPSASRDEPDQKRLQWSSGIQDRLAFFDDTLTVLPLVRYERNQDEISMALPAGQPSGAGERRTYDLWSPSIGIQWQALRHFALRANFGRYQRAPSFTELFGRRGLVVSNRRLRPEDGLNRDVGFVVRAPDLAWIRDARLEYAYFNNDIDDLIVFVQNSQRVFVPLNVGGARLRGHELAAHLALHEHALVDLNYTQQDATNLSPEYFGNRLPGRPEHEIYARLQLLHGWARVYYELNYVAGNFLDQANFDAIPRRDVHSVGLHLDPLDWLSFNFEARNVTDNRIRDLLDFPLPGLSFFGTMTVRRGAS